MLFWSERLGMAGFLVLLQTGPLPAAHFKARAPGLDPSDAAWPLLGGAWPGTPRHPWGLSDSVHVPSSPLPLAGCMLDALSHTGLEKKMKRTGFILFPSCGPVLFDCDLPDPSVLLGEPSGHSAPSVPWAACLARGAVCPARPTRRGYFTFPLSASHVAPDHSGRAPHGEQHRCPCHRRHHRGHNSPHRPTCRTYHGRHHRGHSHYSLHHHHGESRRHQD